MSTDKENNNKKLIDELKKNEEAREKAEIVDEIAYVWTNPTTRDVHFEFFDKPGIDWTTSPDAIWRKFGFISGKVSPSGNIIYLTLEDGTTRVINAVPKSWAADYKSSMEDRLKLLVLQWMRQEENNPELSLKFAEKDEMFQVKYKEMLENGKSFLAKNLKPLQVNLDSGKRGMYADVNASGLKKKKRLTVDIDATSDKPKDWTEDDHMVLLQNLGHKRAKTKEDIKLATSHVSPALARRIIDKGTPIAVVGIVETSADDPVQRILDARWVCRACGHEMHTHMWSYFDKPTAPSICDKCNSEEKSFAENHIVFNTMLIRLQPDLLVTTSQEALTGRIAVLLVGDEQTRLNPVGLKMVIRGHLDRIPLKNGGYEPVIIAQRVLYEEKKLDITFQDELVIRRFAGIERLGYTTIYDHAMKWLEGDGRFTNSPDVYLNRNDVLDRLVSMVAPTHVLGYNERLTALLTATGAPEWPGHRGRIPPLFIGPPGTDKTQFGEWILRLRPTSRKADATNMTGLSATAMVLPDSDGNFNIHFGPFVMARYGICMIDEYEKLDPKERNRLLSGTESGFIWLDKYIHHRKIAAPTTLLATANPRDNKWEDPEAKRISSSEIQIELQQLNRFDIILPFRDIRNLEKDREFGIQKGICEKREKRWKHKGDQTIVELLAKYIEYVRNKFPMITIPPHIDEMFTEYWSQARQREDDMLQKRNLGAIKRIAEAMARLFQVDTVDEDIARRAIKFHSETMEPFLNGIIQVRMPRDEIFYQVVDYVKNKKGQPVMVRETTRLLAERDKRLNDYITGADKNKAWPLEQARNSRYDELCTAIKQHPYIKVLQHKTKNTKLHAFTIAWDTAKYAEDQKLKEQKEKENSSRTIPLLSGNEKTAPSPKSKVVNPLDIVDNTKGAIQKGITILEKSYETRGSATLNISDGGQNQIPDNSGIVLEDASEVVVKTDYSTPMAMLHHSAVSVDLEWDQDKNNQIFQAAFKDHTGRRWAYNLKDEEFKNSEPALIKKIISTMKNYRMVLGYYTTLDFPRSDWDILDERCKRFGIKSPINIYEPPKRDLEDEDEEKTVRYISLQLEGNHGHDIIDVDIGKLHEKPIIKNFFVTRDIIYNSQELSVVAKARLGRGKFKGVTGGNVKKQTPELQKAYGVDDAELCYDLAVANNDVVIAVMDEIANIVKLPFQKVVKTGPSTWWASYYKNVMHIQPSRNRVTGRTYKGGKVLDYKRGDYSKVTVFDFRQLYPNTAIEENLAPDSICCDCCRDEPEAKLFTSDRNINKKGYWRCLKKVGCYPQAAKELTALRSKYEALESQAQDDGDKEKAIEYGLKSTATKIFSNAGYGVFGNKYFEYADVRTAELITAFGRTRLLALKELAESKEFKFEVLYGDTDSVFLLNCPPNKIKAFEELCVKQLKIPARYEKTFTHLLLVSAKNYMGQYVDKKGKHGFMIKGLVGKKSGWPAWTKQVFDKVKDCWVNDDKDMILGVIRDSVEDLTDKRILKRMKDDMLVTVKLGQDPFNGYKDKAQRNLPQRILGQKYKKKKGESVSFYLAHPENSEFNGAPFTEKFERLDARKYIDRLETTVLRILHAMGFDIHDIYDALARAPPPPGELREKLWGKKKKAEEEDDADEGEEEAVEEDAEE